jgi:accessory gene regulator protein AgrB
MSAEAWNLTICATPYLPYYDASAVDCHHTTYADAIGTPYTTLRAVLIVCSTITFVLSLLRCTGLFDKIALSLRHWGDSRPSSALATPNSGYRTISNSENGKDDLSGQNIARRFHKLKNYGAGNAKFLRFRQSLLPRVCVLSAFLTLLFCDPLGYTSMLPIRVWALIADLTGLLSGSVALSAAYAWLRISTHAASASDALRIGHRIAQALIWFLFPIPSIVLLSSPSTPWWMCQIATASLYLGLSALVAIACLHYSFKSWQESQDSMTQAHRFVDAADVLRKRGKSQVVWKGLLVIGIIGIALLGYWLFRCVELGTYMYGIDAGELKAPLATSFGLMLVLCLTPVTSTILCITVLTFPGLFEDPDIIFLGNEY